MTTTVLKLVKSKPWHIQPNGTKTCWLMNEYIVQGHDILGLHANVVKLDEYILCRIYKTQRKEQA
ncbi:putative transcription factor NAM family [Helianthus annuus]|uniref:Putative NAC domain-containing protein n=1 Tax=Helianthus annuus TaxID=4232 RepID=A0A251VBC1_HELAN|nr:putative transcription factor NAM family [Helianthus annuus]KAJ0605532.1 putative transcription factor NAM family [Helianthus annuus]KAJ0619545.1 putative transcription factor NAM family [Helianthus annuus]KAJ0778008.1 putative transcription factor NAM family [Helianthus annuus]KAJ0787013.1 putative transcription factor NAM family [Helianthus annuus]